MPRLLDVGKISTMCKSFLIFRLSRPQKETIYKLFHDLNKPEKRAFMYKVFEKDPESVAVIGARWTIDFNMIKREYYDDILK
jgi:hypothetical protein